MDSLFTQSADMAIGWLGGGNRAELTVPSWGGGPFGRLEFIHLFLVSKLGSRSIYQIYQMYVGTMMHRFSRCTKG